MYHIDHSSKINMIRIYWYIVIYAWDRFHPDTVTVIWITTDTLDIVTSYSGTLLSHVLCHWDIIIVITRSGILVTRGHASILDTVFHVNARYTRNYFRVHISLLHIYWYTRHYYFMFMNQGCTDILFYWIPWLHALYHRYLDNLYTVISCLYTTVT